MQDGLDPVCTICLHAPPVASMPPPPQLMSRRKAVGRAFMGCFGLARSTH